MTEQKPFYNIPKPPKKSYTIIVVEALPDDAPLQCQHTEPIFNKAKLEIGRLVEACDTMSNSVYECPCCGRDICDEHLSDKIQLDYEYVCLDCAKLPGDLQEKIKKLRLELNC